MIIYSVLVRSVYISIDTNVLVFCVNQSQVVMVDRHVINKGNKLLFI